MHKLSKVIALGKQNELTILRTASVGLYLGDGEGHSVLLPNKYVPEQYQLDDTISVFIYRDSQERLVATTLTPKIKLNKFALLKVTAVNNVGAFLDWGLTKELMVPFKEQRQRMEEGRWYVVYMALDPETDRLYASNKIEKRLDNAELTVEEEEKVDLLVYHRSELGYSVIVNNKHRGLVYENELFKTINIGDRMEGWVKKIREGNKLDISITPIGYKNTIDPNCKVIYDALLENDGSIPVTDKSSPDEIYARFSMSKKAFKRAVGALYKQRKITIESDRIKVAKA